MSRSKKNTKTNKSKQQGVPQNNYFSILSPFLDIWCDWVSGTHKKFQRYMQCNNLKKMAFLHSKNEAKICKKKFGHKILQEHAKTIQLALLCIALSRDTPLAHIFFAYMNAYGHMAMYGHMAKYGHMAIYGHLWPYGHRTICDKYGQVGYPWKEQ